MVADDIVEHCGSATAQLYDKLLDQMIFAGAQPSTDTSTRQAAVYGIGVACTGGGAAFSSRTKSALEHLLACIKFDGANSEEEITATDNAVSALGKVCECQAQVIGFDMVSEILRTEWLPRLPLRGDSEESRTVTAHFLRLLQQEQFFKALCGADGSNAASILRVFATLAGDSWEGRSNRTILNDKLRADLRTTMQFLSTMPPIAAASSQLPAQYQAALQSLLTPAQ